jgi:predicted N-acetyltransferase YhbS
MVSIRNEQPADSHSIEQLLDLAFEPERHARPSYRLREGVPKLDALSFVAEEAGHVIGVIRFWPIQIGGTPAVLLGPIAVHPTHEGRGIGTRLVKAGLEAATEADYRIVVAIGTETYLGRFGFKRASPLGLRFPVAVDDSRFLVLELADGALENVSGRVTAARRRATS